MRKLLPLTALLSLTTLAACASGERTQASASRIDELRRSCEARGGMLIPGPRMTGQEALDYPCLIRGGAELPKSQ